MAARAPLLLALAALSAGCSCNPSQTTRAKANVHEAPSPLPSVPEGELPTRDGIYYSFRVADDVSTITGKVCFVGALPNKLVPPNPEAAPLLRAVTTGGRPIATDEGSFVLDAVSEGGCVLYEVDTKAALDAGSLHDGAGSIGRDALLSPDWWLWAPEGGTEGPVFARFETKHPLRAEVPWPRETRGAYTHRVEPSAFIWKAQGSFATRQPFVVALGDSRLDVTVLGPGFGDRDAAVASWLERSAKAVGGLFGGFPLSEGQVLLVADPERSGSYGYALRGGGASATLLLPTRPTDGELAEDWTAVHELLHFSHPPMATAEAWFYEGLATYLTALARARAGMTSKRYGWWELLDGFDRGSKVGTGKTLREECKTMYEHHTYWRVYWSGAAMLLKMDVQLRRKGKTLEGLIAQLAAKRLDETHRWTAEEIVQQLDALCACDIPTRVTAEHLDEAAFPDSSALVKALGVRLAGDKSVTYDDTAPDVAIRRAIMGGD